MPPKKEISEGEELCRQTSAAARAGRYAWRIWSMWVPRTPYVAGAIRGRVVPTLPLGIPVDSDEPTAPGKIHPAVAAALAQHEPFPHDWTNHERVQQRRLYIAALIAIRGIDAKDYGDGSVTKTLKDATIGRQLWASLGALPWSLYGAHGGTAAELRGWRDDELVIDHWQQWLGDWRQWLGESTAA